MVAKGFEESKILQILWRKGSIGSEEAALINEDWEVNDNSEGLSN